MPSLPVPPEAISDPARASATTASAPLGAVLLVGLAVTLTTGVGVAVLDVEGGSAGAGGLGAGDDLAAPATASLSAEATADGRIRVLHEGGDALDIRELDVRIRVDGEPLEHQPPVPFFSAEGFYSGPTGPFNPASDPDWRAGESASLAIAGTNAPAVDAGSRIEIEVYAGGQPVATAEATAEARGG